MESKQFRPMLAAQCKSIEQLRFPLIASPKIDGIRCLMVLRDQSDLFDQNSELVAVGRSLKAIPNRYIQMVLCNTGMLGLDGELVTYTNGKMDPYNTVQSKVMTREGQPSFKYIIFDNWNLEMGYCDRIGDIMESNTFQNVTNTPIMNKVFYKAEDLAKFEEKCIEEGYEGCMTRKPDGPYKRGRSTWKEQFLIKIKRFKDAEATVIGFEELQHNLNEQDTNELGLSERSDHKANKVAGDTLGALICSGHNGIKFKIGTGFDDVMRKTIWVNQEEFLMRIVQYKYQPHGQKDAPRLPVFLGFRDEITL